MARKEKDHFPNDKATHEWLDSFPKSRLTYQTYFKIFVEFTGMSGDEMLTSRKEDKDYAWEKRVFEFKEWMMNKKKKSEYSAVTGTSAARSFFAFHHLPLMYRKSENARLTAAKRKTEDYRFSVEDLKKMADVADLEEQYVIIVGKSFGLRAGDFLRLTRGDLEAYINREPPISIGEYATEKESVKAYPFLDSDAIPVVKLMLEKMNREGRTDTSERMLTYKNEIQLSRVLKRVADKAGITHGSKIVRFHCLRKFLIDRLSSFMSESKWKQIVGKTITEGAYVSPDSLREDYQRAMSETCFVKTTSEADMELLAKKQALMMLAKLQGMGEGEIKTIFRQHVNLTLAGQVRLLEELTESKTQRKTRKSKDDCADGENCQKIITEAELQTALSRGWHFVSSLPSGKIVVSNE